MNMIYSIVGPRDYHAEWSKSEGKAKHHMIPLICEILDKM